MNVSVNVKKQEKARMLTPYFLLMVLAVALGAAGPDVLGKGGGHIAFFYRNYFPVLPVVAVTTGLAGIVLSWDVPPHRRKFIKALALAVGVGLGVMLWWLYFRSGINRIILTGCLAGAAPMVASGLCKKKLPINNAIAWGASFAVAVGVGIWFGVPLWVAIVLAVVTFLTAYVVVKSNYDKAPDREADTHYEEEPIMHDIDKNKIDLDLGLRL